MYDPLRDHYYTCLELAERLDIKPDTLAKYARQGRLPATQPYNGGPWFFPKEEIDALLKKRTRRPYDYRRN